MKILIDTLQIVGQIILLFISYFIVWISSAGLIFYTLAIQLLFVYAVVGLG